MNRLSKSSPSSRIWSCVQACSRSLLHACWCFYSRRRWKPLLYHPTLPPSSSAQPYQLCTAPGPSWWSEMGGLGKNVALNAWSPLFDHQRSLDKGWLCSGPGLYHCNLDTIDVCCQTPSRGNWFYKGGCQEAVFKKLYSHCRKSALVFGSELYGMSVSFAVT